MKKTTLLLRPQRNWPGSMTIDPEKKIELPAGKAEEAADWLLRLQSGSAEPRLKAEFENGWRLRPQTVSPGNEHARRGGTSVW